MVINKIKLTLILLNLATLLLLGCTASEKESITGNAIQGIQEKGLVQKEVTDKKPAGKSVESNLQLEIDKSLNYIEEQSEGLFNNLEENPNYWEKHCYAYKELDLEITDLDREIDEIKDSKHPRLILDIKKAKLDLKFDRPCKEFENTDTPNNEARKPQEKEINYKFTEYNDYANYIKEDLESKIGLNLIHGHAYGGNEGIENLREGKKVYFIVFEHGEWDSTRYWAVEVNAETGRLLKFLEVTKGTNEINRDKLWWIN